MSAEHAGKTKRCLRILEMLCVRALDGISNRELAAALRTSAANVSRDVALLASLGWAETLENGRYAVTAKPLAVLRGYEIHMQNAAARAKELDQRIEARARQFAK